MSNVPASLRSTVAHRSSGRCEYCRLSQASQEATFHVDHIIPTSAGGQTVADNLALACVSCSLRKGARRVAPDPASGDHVPLFNPRRDDWAEHFEWNGVRLAGKTSSGRATIEALDLNRPLILAIRKEEEAAGRHP
jgi:5-methylcytosine-specific restriction endonuclease McrA